MARWADNGPETWLFSPQVALTEWPVNANVFFLDHALTRARSHTHTHTHRVVDTHIYSHFGAFHTYMKCHSLDNISPTFTEMVKSNIWAIAATKGSWYHVEHNVLFLHGIYSSNSSHTYMGILNLLQNNDRPTMHSTAYIPLLDETALNWRDTASGTIQGRLRSCWRIKLRMSLPCCITHNKHLLRSSHTCICLPPGAQVGFNTRASIPTMQIIRYSCAGVDCWVSFTSSYLPFQWEFTQLMSALSIELTWETLMCTADLLST